MFTYVELSDSIIFLFTGDKNMAKVIYSTEGQFVLSVFKTFSEDSLAFAKDIDNIYYAYRTCYSDNPFDLDPSLIKKDKLKAYFIDHLWKTQYVNTVFDSADNYAITYYPTPNSKRSCKLTAKNFVRNVSKYVDSLAAKYGENKFYDYLYKCWFINAHKEHESPIEHAILTYNVFNCSRSLTHQLVRHRIASYSQASQRYITEENKDISVIIPEAITKKAKAKKLVTDYLNKLPTLIKQLKDLGIKNEDIRCIYPNAISTNIVVTMNFRELMHFFKLRMDKHAQREIRELATVVWDCIVTEVPFIFDDFIDLVKKE